MNSERWERVKQLLDQALALDPSERTSFLDVSCTGDPQLRQEVESLLASHEQAGTNFLKAPAVDLTAIGPKLLREGRRIGVYQIVDEIGHGGMGEVYRAVRADGQYTKDVALKLVRGGYDTASVLERFRNERQILASLDHPNIARLLDGGTTDDGIPYLVMELIEGKPVDKYCDEHKFSVTERLLLFRQVCAAVQYAHQRLVIHRDIKPSNVLVTKEGEPKLLDFGIAKIVSPIGDAQTTLTQAMTPEYASPEQIRGDPITTATDVYSLGVMLYQLLTGRSPYPGDTRTPHKLAQAVCETEPGRPSTVVVKREIEANEQKIDPEQISSTREGSPAKLQRRLAGDLDDILLMALRKEAATRYGSVEQFAEDIRRHLEGLAVLASRGSWTYRARKFINRHRVGITAAAVIALAVLAGVLATVREAHVAQKERLRAEKRFKDVRKLANSLMLDLHSSLNSPPGSTTARKAVIQESLEYLDSLSQEAGGDLSLQRELASAYESLGNVQGNPYQSHLGDPEGALASYRKALAIRQAVAKSGSATANDQVALAVTFRKLGGIQWMSVPETTAALESLRQSVTILEAVTSSHAEDVSMLADLADSYDHLADIQSGNGPRGSVGDTRSGLENHRKNLAIRRRIAGLSPQDSDAKVEFARAEVGVGDDLVKLGERGQAMDYFREAIGLEQPLAHVSGRPETYRSLSSSYSRMGDALVMSGRPLEAAEYFRRQFDLVQAPSAADPRDADLQARVILSRASLGNALLVAGRVKEGTRLLLTSLAQAETLAKSAGDTLDITILAFVEVWVGEALEKSGRLNEAAHYYSLAFQRYSSVLSADPKDLEDRVNAAVVSAHLGRVSVKLGQLGQAGTYYEEALRQAESAMTVNADNMEAQYALADCYAGLGELHAAMSRTGTPQDCTQQRQEANDWRAKSLSAWAKIPNPSRISPNGFEVADYRAVKRQPADCKTLAHDREQ